MASMSEPNVQSPRHHYLPRPEHAACCSAVAARPCPGRCNAAYRAAERVAEKALTAAWAAGEEPDPTEHVPTVTARAGQPWWCAGCAEEVVTAIGRLPELAALLYDAGHEPEPVVVHRVISRTQVGGPAGSIWREVLTCRHPVRYVGPAQTVALRVCTMCAAEAPSSTGRLAPQSRAERRSMTPTSPSGSPSWDAIDELVSWAAEAEDLARLLLGLTRLPYGRERSSSSDARARVLSSSVQFLATWSGQWLQTRRGVELGHAALRLVKRAERSAGDDVLVHRLPAPCPSCDRLGLERTDGSDQVDCRYCQNSWPEDDYRRLTLILASEASTR